MSVHNSNPTTTNNIITNQKQMYLSVGETIVQTPVISEIKNENKALHTQNLQSYEKVMCNK